MLLQRSLEPFRSHADPYLNDIPEEVPEGEEGTGEPVSINLPEPFLKFKRVDYYYNWWSKDWKYKTMGAKVIAERRTISSMGDSDPWAGYCFVFVRTLPSSEEPGPNRPTFKFVVKSQYLLKVRVLVNFHARFPDSLTRHARKSYKRCLESHGTQIRSRYVHICALIEPHNNHTPP